MSTILKALKKAERDGSKGMQAALTQPIRIRSRKRLICGLVVLGVAVGLWVGYLFSVVPPLYKEVSQHVVRRKEPSSRGDLPAVQQVYQPSNEEGAQDFQQELDSEEPRIVGSTVLATESSPHSLELSGVIYDLVNPMAIINGRFVGVGDSIAGAEVIEIERNKVRISLGGSEQLLRITR